MYGGIEAGGTKFVCAVADEKLKIINKITIPTTVPSETMAKVISFFKEYRSELKSIGIGSFGPIDVNEQSKTYGYITTTPKKNWENFNFIKYIKTYYDVPLIWTTDVNAAAFGEYTHSYKDTKKNVVYLTVGTGIGGGAIFNGQLVQGFGHPEMGHMLVRRHARDSFKGSCPIHVDCLEGMSSGPSIEQRLGLLGQDIRENHEFWDIEAYYLAQCAYNITLILSPDVIIFGGGVMQQSHLIEKIRKSFSEILKSYVKTPKLNTYIVTPKLGQDAGIVGALSLAIQ